MASCCDNDEDEWKIEMFLCEQKINFSCYVLVPNTKGCFVLFATYLLSARNQCCSSRMLILNSFIVILF